MIFQDWAASSKGECGMNKHFLIQMFIFQNVSFCTAHLKYYTGRCWCPAELLCTRQVHQASSCCVGCKVLTAAPPPGNHLIKRSGSQKGNINFTWKLATTTDSEPTPELLNQTLEGGAQKSVLCRAPSDSDSQWSLRTTVLVDGNHLVLEPGHHPHPTLAPQMMTDW